MLDRSAVGTPRGVVGEVLAEISRLLGSPGYDFGDVVREGEGFAGAAICYALRREDFETVVTEAGGEVYEPLLYFWPTEWDLDWFMPTNRRADLVCAAALLILEVSRLEFISMPRQPGEGVH